MAASLKEMLAVANAAVPRVPPAEARALIARLRDDPDDDEAQRAFDRLAGRPDAVD
jgi:hypothetical protein